MIKINIVAEGEKIFDNFKKSDCNLMEVSSALLRLKQIEQKLINMNFDSDLEVVEDE